MHKILVLLFRQIAPYALRLLRDVVGARLHCSVCKETLLRVPKMEFVLDKHGNLESLVVLAVPCCRIVVSATCTLQIVDGATKIRHANLCLPLEVWEHVLNLRTALVMVLEVVTPVSMIQTAIGAKRKRDAKILTSIVQTTVQPSTLPLVAHATIIETVLAAKRLTTANGAIISELARLRELPQMERRLVSSLLVLHVIPIAKPMEIQAAELVLL